MLRDPLSWSLPLGRVFGITVRVHVFFVVVFLGLVLHHAWGKTNPPPIPGQWIDMAIIFGLLFASILLHEFGHCFGARGMDGDAQEILVWPLGGLAQVEVPQTPRAHLVTALCGPLVNLALLFAAGSALVSVYHYWPPLSLIGAPVRSGGTGVIGELSLYVWGAGEKVPEARPAVVLLAWLFWVNWMLFLFNLLPGFPLDGGRMLQATLWRYVGYRQATLAAVFAGFVTMLVVAMFAFVFDSTLALALALYIAVCCRQEWIILETGGEDGAFGYDFSQGYTSLERDQGVPASPPRRRQNWWQRWRQNRAVRKIQREQEQREAEELRMDALLEKVKRDGLSALSEEEKRFLRRVSDRYRNRQ